MEAITSHLTGLAMTVLSSALFGLIGFVWRISHKVSANEKETAYLKSELKGLKTQTKHDTDYLLGKLDAHNDKMYSIVKNKRD